MRGVIVAIRTDAPIAQLELLDAARGSRLQQRNPELGRAMARDLLAELVALLQAAHQEWSDVSGIVLFTGPGSFTGLRIGATIANTIAYAEKIPLVGAASTSWVDEGVGRLQAGEDDKLVMPQYGAEAHITQPRK